MDYYLLLTTTYELLKRDCNNCNNNTLLDEVNCEYCTSVLQNQHKLRFYQQLALLKLLASGQISVETFDYLDHNTNILSWSGNI